MLVSTPRQTFACQPVPVDPKTQAVQLASTSFLGSQVSPLFAGLLGLGEYPGYYCYDANRPALLPYWIDDITESLCKYNPKTIVGNIYDCAVGDPTCGTPSGAALDPTLSGPGVADPGTQANVPTCGPFTSYNPTSGACQFSLADPFTLGSLLLIGFVAFKGVF